MEPADKVFLSAEWRKLLMANYVVPPSYLEVFVPPGAELDYWEGKCYVSLVGFMFLNTAVKGVRFPMHTDFEEINLRFYVRRKEGNQWRRGVVFIKEIVPKPAIAWVANAFFGERYETRLMQHSWNHGSGQILTSYAWKPFFGGNWCKMNAEHSAVAQSMAAGSEAEFITEHYWGYAKHKQRKHTIEYEVRHPRWDVYAVSNFKLEGSTLNEYGPIFSKVLAGEPSSVFLAEGSAVEVMSGRILDQ
jgi:uncharacterized protein